MKNTFTTKNHVFIFQSHNSNFIRLFQNYLIIQVDAGSHALIGRLRIQRLSAYDEADRHYVTNFYVTYSLNGWEWNSVLENGEVKVYLSCSIFPNARVIRYVTPPSTLHPCYMQPQFNKGAAVITQVGYKLHQILRDISSHFTQWMPQVCKGKMFTFHITAC